MIEIRDVHPDDAEGIARVLNPIIAARRYTALDTCVTVEEEREFIRQFPGSGVFHVATDIREGRIVGLQNVSPFATYTHAFDHVGVIGTYVDLTRLRQGISRRLFAATFAAAVVKGYHKLFTFVRADNEAGLGAYLGQGFRVVGRAERHARIDGAFVDEVVIEKLLST